MIMLRMAPHRRGLPPIRVLVPEEALIRVTGTRNLSLRATLLDVALDSLLPLQQSLNLISVIRRGLPVASLLASKSYLTN
jgi:hypothetical protein